MQFVITAYDGAGLLARRMEVRPRHMEGMARMAGHVLCAGGLLDEEGKMKGSVLVMEFKDREELDAYLAQEPYVTEYPWGTTASISPATPSFSCWERYLLISDNLPKLSE